MPLDGVVPLGDVSVLFDGKTPVRRLVDETKRTLLFIVEYEQCIGVRIQCFADDGRRIMQRPTEQALRDFIAQHDHETCRFYITAKPEQLTCTIGVKQHSMHFSDWQQLARKIHRACPTN